jgi:tRNA U34 5-carboxymethylaminomethyl modifying GTPase MnmE/TrmE
VAIEKLFGVIALGVLLFWVFRDAVGTSSILNSLAGANRSFVGNLQGHTTIYG